MGFSAPATWAMNHPERQWEVLETPHFSVHYYKETKNIAQRIAVAAEEVLPKIAKDLNVIVKQPIPVVVTQDMLFNGQAEPLKDRIYLDPVLAMSSVIGTKRFIAHELTHVITFRALSSEDPLSKFTNLAGVPSWFLEGIAQYEGEYWTTSEDRMLRLCALEGKILTDNQRNNFQLMGLYGGAAGYNEGYALTKYLLETYGNDKLPKLFATMKKDPTLSFALAVEKTFGKKLSALQTDWQRSVTAKYKKEASTIPAMPEQSVSLVASEHGSVNIAPKLSPDGKTLAWLSSKDQDGYLYLRGHALGLLTLYTSDAQGKNRQKIAFGAGRILSYCWAPDSKAVIVSMLASDNNGNPEAKLFHYTPSTREIRPLTQEGFAISPTWRPNTQEVTYLEQEDGKASLWSMDIKTKKKTQIPVKLGEGQLDDLTWSPDGSKLAATYFLPGDGQKLVLIDSKGTLTPLTGGDTTYNDENPAWSNDGKSIWFSSNRDGLGNLYRIQLANKVVTKSTHCYNGIDHPLPVGDKLVAVAYRAQGSELISFPPQKEALTQMPKALESPAPPKEQAEPGFSINRRAYTPTLTTDIVVPQITSDERGQQIGVAALYSDILNKHQLGLDVRFGLFSQRFSYQASYINHMGKDSWGINLYDRPQINLTERIDPQHFYDNLYVGREQGASLGYSKDLGSGRRIGLGANAAYLSALTTPEADLPVRQGRHNTLTVGFSENRIQGGRDADIQPKGGHFLNASYILSDRHIGSDFNYSQWVLSGGKYFPIGSTALGFQFLGGIQKGDNTPFFLGGAQGSGNLVPLRGFLAGSFAGDRLAFTGLDYTVPISTNLDVQLGAFYLNKLYASAFVEGGGAWSAQDAFRPHSSAGLELRLKTAFMGGQVVNFKLGVAHQLTDDRITSVYLLF